MNPAERTGRGRPTIPALAKVPAELTGSGGTLGVVLVHDVYGRGPCLRSVAEVLFAAGIPSVSVDRFAAVSREASGRGCG